MKSLLLIISLVMALFAEPSFQDVQSMIEHQQFKQAKLALTIINNNHPNSSKVYYTLAQANAGLGDLPAAKDALDHAKALNPKLDFVPLSQVVLLEQAITPQAHLVKPVESSSTGLMFIILISSLSIGIIWYIMLFRKPKPKPTLKPEQPSTKYSYTPTPPSSGSSSTTSTSTYVDPTPSKPTEIHHHHHSDSGMGTAGTILTAGLTAAAVSSMMDHHQATPIVIHNEYPEYTSRSSYSEPTSTSWEDSKPSYTSTHSSDYEDSTSRSSSWSDSSSSSSSWSDSSSSSSSWD